MTLARRLRGLEVRRRRLFARLEELDSGSLNRRPGENRWSMIQVMCHLIRAEELSLSYIQRKIESPEGLPDVWAKGWLRTATLAAALRSPFRFEAPAAVAEVPEEEALDETRRRWEEVRAGWSRLVESFPPELVRKGVFRHPFAGRMTLEQALVFLSEHFRHHEKQIERIRRASA